MTKMSVRQAMDIAESDDVHDGATRHALPLCSALITLHDEIERLTKENERLDAEAERWSARYESLK